MIGHNFDHESAVVVSVKRVGLALHGIVDVRSDIIKRLSSAVHDHHRDVQLCSGGKHLSGRVVVVVA